MTGFPGHPQPDATTGGVHCLPQEVAPAFQATRTQVPPLEVCTAYHRRWHPLPRPPALKRHHGWRALLTTGGGTRFLDHPHSSATTGGVHCLPQEVAPASDSTRTQAPPRVACTAYHWWWHPLSERPALKCRPWRCALPTPGGGIRFLDHPHSSATTGGVHRLPLVVAPAIRATRTQVPSLEVCTAYHRRWHPLPGPPALKCRPWRCALPTTGGGIRFPGPPHSSATTGGVHCLPLVVAPAVRATRTQVPPLEVCTAYPRRWHPLSRPPAVKRHPWRCALPTPGGGDPPLDSEKCNEVFTIRQQP